MIASLFSPKKIISDIRQQIPFEPSMSAFFGPGIGNQPSHDVLLRETLGIMDSCTKAIANRVATLEFVVKESLPVSEGSLSERIIDDHPLQRLLSRPHEDFSRFQFLRLTTQWICIVGEAYWYKVPNGLNLPVELQLAPPSQIRPMIHEGVIIGYEVTDGGGLVERYGKRDFVRMFMPDPENMWGSEGIIGPSAISLDTSRFAGEHLRAKYQHDATPSTVIEANEHAAEWTPEVQERFYIKWRDSYQTRVGSRVGLPAILPTGYRLVELAMQSGADITPLLEHLRDDLLMASGVPRSILGQVLSGDRSSAETNAFVFDLHTVKPYAAMIADALTGQLAIDYQDNLIVDFKEFVSEDKDHRLAQEQSDLDRKVRSINEIRIDHNHVPSDWGDEPIGTTGDVPYDPEEARERATSAAKPQGPDNGRPEGDDDEPMEPEEVDRVERDLHAKARLWAREQRKLSRSKLRA
ncbi:MAG TPA: phage portal protein [Candidatus Heimdallarchaeota archaeon]|nr:phage portal protein [Candidatus Heimdallarchaeota archaeon]